MQHFLIDCEYRTSDNVRSIDVEFLSTDANVVHDFIKFWDNRHSAIPSEFYQLLSFKIYKKTIYSLNSDGSLVSNSAQLYMEFKERDIFNLTGRYPY